MKAQRGFTLIELMIAVLITGILAALAAPGFKKLIVSSSISSDANALVSDLAIARSEAAKSGSSVSVCISTDGQTCSAGTNWGSGRIVFNDGGTIGTVDGTDVVLRATRTLSSNTLAEANFPNNNYVTYSSTGMVTGLVYGTDGTFTICRKGYSGAVVSVSITGRVSTSATTSICP